MDLLGKWEVIKVLKNFDDNLKPIYQSKEEALQTDEFKDEQSITFITSIYELKEDCINIITKIRNEKMREDAIKQGLTFLDDDTVITQTLGAEIEDGIYYFYELSDPDNKSPMPVLEDGTISFMIMLVLKKIA